MRCAKLNAQEDAILLKNLTKERSRLSALLLILSAHSFLEREGLAGPLAKETTFRWLLSGRAGACGQWGVCRPCRCPVMHSTFLSSDQCVHVFIHQGTRKEKKA